MSDNDKPNKPHHPGSENLMPPWKPGESPFRDKWQTMSDAEKAEHGKKISEGKERGKLKRLIEEGIEARADAIAEGVLKGLQRIAEDDNASSADIKMILDRVLGTPKQSIEVDGEVSMAPIVLTRKAKDSTDPTGQD